MPLEPSPFAEPDELPNFVGDLLEDVAFSEAGLPKRLRLVSGSWRRFVDTRVRHCHLRLDGALQSTTSDEGEGEAFTTALVSMKRYVQLRGVTAVQGALACQDMGLQLLACLPLITTLDLAGWTLLSPQGLESLSKGCPRLESLTLALENTSLGEAIRALAPLAASLARLDISAPAAGEGDLCMLTGVTSLQLRGPPPASAAASKDADWDDDEYGGCILPVAWLRSSMPTQGQERISDAALLAVACLPHLEGLRLEVGRASHVGITALSRLTSLCCLHCLLDGPSPGTTAALSELGQRKEGARLEVVVEQKSPPMAQRSSLQLLGPWWWGA